MVGIFNAARIDIAARARHFIERYATGDRRLVAGRAVDFVIKNKVNQIAWLLRTDQGQCAHIHEDVAITVKDNHAPLGFTQGHAERNR